VIKSRRLRWAGYIVRMGEGKCVLKILREEPTEKRSSGRPRQRWEDDIRMNFKEMGISTRNWVDSAQYKEY
jgi:hypothetical protein